MHLSMNISVCKKATTVPLISNQDVMTIVDILQILILEILYKFNESVDRKSVAMTVSLSVLDGLGRSVGQSSQKQSLWPPGLDYRDYIYMYITTCLCIGFAMLWYVHVDLSEFTLCNRVRWQEPALAKISDLLATHFWSRCVQIHLVQGNINSMMAKYVYIMYESCCILTKMTMEYVPGCPVSNN